ncbi:cytochrome c oxidase subunit 3 [Fodinicola acaciae]|uniref:aa3-type cytochrome oxidase subunit III n=1 Tax=Fodinicola acaciae TaxID=2681555 RepID=UPI0013D4267B|nr:heme-copper oxidase subunit III [Fodinicola acaciae]
MRGVTASAAVFDKSQVHSLTRPNIVSVGTIIWLSSELMFFAALFAMFFSIRAIHPELWHESHEHLELLYATPFTIVLVLSSVTCQLGVFCAERGDVYGLRRWYAITLIMGAVFVGGQVGEYSKLYTEGINLSTNGWSSMFFLTTGFHALHVIGGLVAFVYLMIRSTMGRFTPAQATAAIVVSYYWHFVDIVWIVLFAMIYLMPTSLPGT